jgi:hypothetical protein
MTSRRFRVSNLETTADDDDASNERKTFEALERRLKRATPRPQVSAFRPEAAEFILRAASEERAARRGVI